MEVQLVKVRLNKQPDDATHIVVVDRLTVGMQPPAK